MRPSAVVDGSSLLRNDVQFVAGERQQLKRIAALARTMLVPLHLFSWLLLLLLVHRMKTLCGSGWWPPWETLGVGAGTRSDAPMGAEGRWEHLLLPGTRSHPRYFCKNNANNKRQSLRRRGWRLQWKVEVVDIKPLFQPGTYSHPQGFPLHPTYLQNKHLKSRRYLCH